MPDGIRAASYARVSTERQAKDDRNSLDIQREAFRARCVEMGYTPSGEFTDVESGRRNTRPGYQRLLRAAREGQHDVIVVSYLDRFGRREEEIALRVLELRAMGITVDVIHEDVSEFIPLVLSAWKADQESRRIGERTSQAMLAAARRGVVLGRAPYGYEKRWDFTEDGHKTNHRLEIYEPDAVWVRRVFQWYVQQNVSLREIAHRLNMQAPPRRSGKPWHPEEIRKMLRRRKYVGDWTWRGDEVVVPDAHPPIIVRELWAEAQARIAVKAKMAPGKTQRSAYLLTGLLQCGHCGGPMHGSTSRSREGNRRRRPARLYVCSRHRKQRTCPYPNNHEASRVERAVIAALQAVVGDVDVIREQFTYSVGEQREGLELIERDLERLERRLVQNLELFARGTIATEAQLATANQALAEQQDRLNREADRVRGVLADAEGRSVDAEELTTRLRTLEECFGTSPIGRQKGLLQQLVSKVEITEGEQVPRLTLRVLAP